MAEAHREWEAFPSAGSFQPSVVLSYSPGTEGVKSQREGTCRKERWDWQGWPQGAAAGIAALLLGPARSTAAVHTTTSAFTFTFPAPLP